MNKHILLVMKWLKNPETISRKELLANYYAYAADANAAAYWAAAYAAADADAAARAAAYWVDRYFQITGEDKQAYIDKLGE
jgi:hypothetical protein